MHISLLKKGLRPIMRKSIKFLFCWVVLQCECVCVYVSLCVCLVEQAFMDVGYIKHHHQSLISHSLYVLIDNFVERHTHWNNCKCVHTHGQRALCLCRYVCLSVHANVQSCAFGVTPVVSQMLSAHLQQMVAGSNGPALCVVDLSVHQYHAQVHPTRSTT